MCYFSTVASEDPLKCINISQIVLVGHFDVLIFVVKSVVLDEFSCSLSYSSNAREFLRSLTV